MSSSQEQEFLTKYQNLSDEIKKTIQNNEAIYKNIASGEYKDTDNFKTELNKFDIKSPSNNTGITQSRDNIWNYLVQQYNEHTKMRKFYFEQIKNESEYLEQLVNEKTELEGKLADYDAKNNVIISHIKEEKYSISGMNYYFNMFKYLLMLELLIILFIGIGMTGILPKLTVLLICLVLGIIGIWIVYYYVYYNNVNRNKFVWEKRDYPDLDESGVGQCVAPKMKKSEDIKREKIDADLQKYIRE